MELPCGSAHMAACHDRLEQHQEIEVGAREINVVQHIAEIVSFDAGLLKRDCCPWAGGPRRHFGCLCRLCRRRRRRVEHPQPH
jgi:hypothetical protein